ncbi:MAG: NAD(P)H-hydrate dehydratase [Magnetococcales bacterium]|nr:NAD(P)H-hydrate dehydratase [Magnetococcales bacterium]
MKLLNSEQMRIADNRTIKEIGLPGVVLMENAGAGVTRILKNRCLQWKSKQIVILAGGGNNGGDGFVIARRLLQSGARVSLLLFSKEDTLQGDALLHFQVFKNLGGRIKEITSPQHLKSIQSTVVHSCVVVDAIFGTGLTRPVEGVIAQAFKIINQLQTPILAVDIPSGVCANSGNILGCALSANWTVTFAAQKIGHCINPGARLCGEIITIPIGIPSEFIDSDNHTVARNQLDDLNIPNRKADGHKGDFGHLLIVAGSEGKEGAATLTALGALRTGPGLVTVATPKPSRQIIAGKLTEAMTIPLPTEGDQHDHATNWVDNIQNSEINPKAMAIGPGLGTHSNLAICIQALTIKWNEIPIILDADALNLLAISGGEIQFITQQRTSPLILTPHPGELARLLQLSVGEIQQDRLGIAVKTAKKWQVWLVLKGADTIIASPDGRAWINDNGNSGLASGGSGDLLTGIIAGLITQGWPIETGVRCGVWLHGAAADAAVADGNSESGLLAQDLLPYVIKLQSTLMNG